MRNQYAGKCYMCRETVQPGEGHYERFDRGWLTIHADCVFVLREAKDKCRAMRHPTAPTTDGSPKP